MPNYMPKLSGDGLSWQTNAWDSAQTSKQVATGRAVTAADFECQQRAPVALP